MYLVASSKPSTQSIKLDKFVSLLVQYRSGVSYQPRPVSRESRVSSRKTRLVSRESVSGQIAMTLFNPNFSETK